MKIGNWAEPLGDGRYRVRKRTSRHSQELSYLILEPDKEYVIIPTNKNTLKNRNRRCIFIAGNGTEATIKFSDTGRKSTISMDNLVELSDTVTIEESVALLNKKLDPKFWERAPHPERDLRTIARELNAKTFITFRGTEFLLIPKTKKKPDLSAGGFLHKILGSKEKNVPDMIGGPRAVTMGISDLIGYMVSEKQISNLTGEKIIILKPEEKTEISKLLQIQLKQSL